MTVGAPETAVTTTTPYIAVGPAYRVTPLGLPGEPLHESVGSNEQTRVIFSRADLAEQTGFGRLLEFFGIGAVTTHAPNQTSGEVGRYVAEHGLQSALNDCSRLVKSVFGEQAHIAYGFEPDEETGEMAFVVTAHYALGGDEEAHQVAGMHRRFMDAYLDTVRAEQRRRMVLTWVSLDADRA